VGVDAFEELAWSEPAAFELAALLPLLLLLLVVLPAVLLLLLLELAPLLPKDIDLPSTELAEEEVEQALAGC